MDDKQRQRFRTKLDALDYDGLVKLKSDLAGRVEVARMRFSKSRSTRDSESYANRRFEYGVVRTQMQLRFPKGRPDADV